MANGAELQGLGAQIGASAHLNYTRKHSDGLDPGFVLWDLCFKADCTLENRARTEAETISEVMGRHFQEPRNFGSHYWVAENNNKLKQVWIHLGTSKSMRVNLEDSGEACLKLCVN